MNSLLKVQLCHRHFNYQYLSLKIKHLIQLKLLDAYKKDSERNTSYKTSW